MHISQPYFIIAELGYSMCYVLLLLWAHTQIKPTTQMSNRSFISHEPSSLDCIL